ncbi:MAG: cytochrome P450 [Actinobacteria bacterium]|nr:cytochrome P450 [Actinomycetota bacterium]
MIDFNNPTFVADPYEQLKELRQFGKPVWHEGMQIFLAARHSDANDVFRNKSLGRIFTDKKPDFEWETFNWLHSDSILDSEPPKHTRLRSLVAKAFNRNKIEGMRPAVERITHKLLDAINEKVKSGTTFDLIADYAKLNSHELVATCVLLLNAGHEASVNAFGNGMVAVLERPDQADLLRKNSRAITQTALEEFMRFDAPLHLFERTATVDTEVGGVKIEQGQKIAALIGSANRDSEVFERADEMDLTRDPNPHIGFGAGIHFCLGAPLARLEMSVSLPALWEKYPNMQLAENPVRRPTFVLRGYERVSISV